MLHGGDHEHEHRRTEVRHPPREEEARLQPGQILGGDLEPPLVAGSDEVADVIERHQDDDEAAQQIDGGEAGGARSERIAHVAAHSTVVSSSAVSHQSAARRRPLCVDMSEVKPPSATFRTGIRGARIRRRRARVSQREWMRIIRIANGVGL